MDSSITVQQQRPAAFWIYTGFIVIEVAGFVGFLSPIVSIPALVMFLVAGAWAYSERGRDSILDTHYQFQIRTFWVNVVVGLALPFLFLIAIIAGVGSFLMDHNSPTSLVLSVMAGTMLPIALGLILAIWTIVRSLVGLSRLKEGKPIDNPTTWMV
jgi:uncharacterized membrane protein